MLIELTCHINFLGNSEEYRQGVMRQVHSKCFSQLGHIEGVVSINNRCHSSLAISTGNLISP
jgi:hypothetical protein